MDSENSDYVTKIQGILSCNREKEFALNIFRGCEGISPAQHEINLNTGTDGASHHFQFLEEQSQERKMSSSLPARIFQSWQCWAEQHSLQLILT